MTALPPIRESAVKECPRPACRAPLVITHPGHQTCPHCHAHFTIYGAGKWFPFASGIGYRNDFARHITPRG